MKLTYNYGDISVDIKANEIELIISYQAYTIPVEELQNIIDIAKFVKDKLDPNTSKYNQLQQEVEADLYCGDMPLYSKS